MVKTRAVRDSAFVLPLSLTAYRPNASPQAGCSNVANDQTVSTTLPRPRNQVLAQVFHGLKNRKKFQFWYCCGSLAFARNYERFASFEKSQIPV